VTLHDTVCDTAARCQHHVHQIIATRAHNRLAAHRAIAAQQDPSSFFGNGDQASYPLRMNSIGGQPSLI
jgi:hypothetical protein